MRKGFISEEIDRQNGIACEGLTADQSRAMLKIISQIGERYSLSVLIKKYVNDVDKFKQELDVMLKERLVFLQKIKNKMIQN
jgi:hypothetical protein